MTIRIIPRLDIKGPNLVKGINFEGLRVLGTPEVFARHYYAMGADELFYQDAVASLYGRNSLLDIVERTSREIFIPLCVGGGLRSVDDVQAVLRAGADKVAINTAAIERPELIEEVSNRFGSSTLVVAVEAQRNGPGDYEALVNYGRDTTGVNAIDWAVEAAERGAGEILLTAVANDGTGMGMDTELSQALAGRVQIPVILGGGCSKPADAADAVETGKADAVSLASILHYGLLEEMRAQHGDDHFKDEGNVRFLKGGMGFSKIRPTSLADIRAELQRRGIPCRKVGPGDAGEIANGS